MERSRSSPKHSRIERQLSQLKIISRLLGHELHAQQSPRLTLSRESVQEIQTTIDLYIEEVMRSRGAFGASGSPGGVGGVGGELEVQAVPARVN